MKDDEKRFLLDIYENAGNGYLRKAGMFPREIINQDNFYIHHKRALYLLDKWGRKGWYEWGVTIDLGWLTPEGIEEARKYGDYKHTEVVPHDRI